MDKQQVRTITHKSTTGSSSNSGKENISSKTSQESSGSKSSRPFTGVQSGAAPPVLRPASAGPVVQRTSVPPTSSTAPSSIKISDGIRQDSSSSTVLIPPPPPLLHSSASLPSSDLAPPSVNASQSSRLQQHKEDLRRQFGPSILDTKHKDALQTKISQYYAKHREAFLAAAIAAGDLQPSTPSVSETYEDEPSSSAYEADEDDPETEAPPLFDEEERAQYNSVGHPALPSKHYIPGLPPTNDELRKSMLEALLRRNRFHQFSSAKAELDIVSDRLRERSLQHPHVQPSGQSGFDNAKHNAGADDPVRVLQPTHDDHEHERKRPRLDQSVPMSTKT